MTSTSDTGHAKNVANFEILISQCIGYGNTYNPPFDYLKIPQMQEILKKAEKSMQFVTYTRIIYDNTCDSLEIAFTNLKELCANIVNIIESANLEEQTIIEVKIINQLIQNENIWEKEINSNETTNDIITPLILEQPQIFVCQQHFNNLIKNFYQLILKVNKEPLYVPCESVLNITEFNFKLENIKKINIAVIDAYFIYCNAKHERDIMLYQPDSGLVDIALNIKMYVNKLFKDNSLQFKQIKELEFKRPKKN